MVSIIIPTKEEPLLQSLVDDINRILAGIPHEVIVIDKGDRPPLIKGASVISQRSSGLGHAVLEGLSHARGDLILVMDGDFSHSPSDLPRLINALKQSDIVLGSRFVPGGKNLDFRSRDLVSRVYRGVAHILLRLQLEDPMSGFCAARREVYDVVRLNPIGYKVNLELVFKARQKGFRVAEIPIIFYPRRAGRSKTGVEEGLRTLFFMLALRLGLR